MNREIKFRAWDGNRKRFSYFFLHQFGIDIPVESYYPVTLHRSDDDELYRLEYKDIEFMQFTGLKDKNGKDIYEGDIIKWPIGYNDYATLTMYIGYNELGMRLYKRLPCMCCGGHKGGSIPSFGVFKKCEVIGNIYENAELLKDN